MSWNQENGEYEKSQSVFYKKRKENSKLAN